MCIPKRSNKQWKLKWESYSASLICVWHFKFKGEGENMKNFSRVFCAQSSKLNLVLPSQILGLFGPSKKRVIYSTFNKRQICVFCVFTPNYLSNKLLMLYSCVLFLLFTIACIPTLFWYIYLKKGQRVSQRIDKEKVNQLFGPPNILWSPAHVRRVRRL